MKKQPIIQIFILIIILIACFKLGEIKGRYDIVKDFTNERDINALISDFKHITNR